MFQRQTIHDVHVAFFLSSLSTGYVAQVSQKLDQWVVCWEFPLVIFL
jgi:hypothetical protein